MSKICRDDMSKHNFGQFDTNSKFYDYTPNRRIEAKIKASNQSVDQKTGRYSSVEEYPIAKQDLENDDFYKFNFRYKNIDNSQKKKDNYNLLKSTLLNELSLEKYIKPQSPLPPREKNNLLNRSSNSIGKLSSEYAYFNDINKTSKNFNSSSRSVERFKKQSVYDISRIDEVSRDLRDRYGK
jgi:hypothetical protein